MKHKLMMNFLMGLFTQQMKLQIHLTVIKRLPLILSHGNIQLDDILTNGLKEFKEVNEKTTFARIKNKKIIVQNIIAILIKS